MTEPEPIYSPDYIDAVVLDISSSFRLALESAGVPETTIRVVERTVADYIDNHYDERWQR